jgi:hypothetical protein
MHAFDDTPVPTFGPLTQSECIRLLETHSLGRWRGRRPTASRSVLSITPFAQVSCTSAPRRRNPL